MLCDICHKNDATIHLTQVINGKMTELHICESCAIEKGLLNKDKSGMNIGDILSSLMGFMGESRLSEKKQQELKCSFCGMTFADFQKLGKLGCSECYHAFEEQLKPLFRKIHGHTQHTGKMPKRISKYMVDKRQLNDLKRKLEEAIKEERFEDAAKLRDEIKKLQQKLGDSKDDRAGKK